MRIKITCFECCGGRDVAYADVTSQPLRDDGLYRFTCSRGHVAIIVLEQLLFEVLAEVALQALLDGYCREAVSSFASSLERFYEFYFRVVSRTRGTEPATISAAWKLIQAQSERQLGAFVSLYLTENGKAPPLLGDVHVAVRNRVVHQGKIPTEAEAVAYGQAVVEYVQARLNEMHPRHFQGIRDEVLEHQRVALQLLKPGETPGFMARAMGYVLHPVEDTGTLDVALTLKRRRDGFEPERGPRTAATQSAPR